MPRDLKVYGESLGAVDNSMHWNFSIWSTNKGVMAILVEGYKPFYKLPQYPEQSGTL